MIIESINISMLLLILSLNIIISISSFIICIIQHYTINNLMKRIKMLEDSNECGF